MVGIGRAALWAGRQQTLGDVVYNQVLAMILEGQLPTNARLPSETALAQRFGVSRPVVRQALAKLREEHLIASRQGSGSFVQFTQSGPPLHAPSQPILRFASLSSTADLRRYCDFRIAVECESAASAARNRTQGQLDALTASLTTLEGLADTEDFGVDVDYAFHLKIAEAADNVFILTTLQALREHIVTAMTLMRILSPQQRGKRLRLASARHSQIVEAIAARSPDDARHLMHLHLTLATQRLLSGPASPSARRAGGRTEGEGF